MSAIAYQPIVTAWFPPPLRREIQDRNHRTESARFQHLGPPGPRLALILIYSQLTTLCRHSRHLEPTLSFFVDLHSAVFGAVTGYLVLWLSCQAHHILTGRAGMGHGDFKLFAAIGTWLGVQMLPVVLALACISCLLFLVCRKCFYGQGMRVSVCFGPFLSLAAFVAILIWPWL